MKASPQTNGGYHSDPPTTEIGEGQGRPPLWLWLLIGAFVVVAFFVGPFRVF